MSYLYTVVGNFTHLMAHPQAIGIPVPTDPAVRKNDTYWIAVLHCAQNPYLYFPAIATKGHLEHLQTCMVGGRRTGANEGAFGSVICVGTNGNASVQDILLALFNRAHFHGIDSIAIPVFGLGSLSFQEGIPVVEEFAAALNSISRMGLLCTRTFVVLEKEHLPYLSFLSGQIDIL